MLADCLRYMGVPVIPGMGAGMLFVGVGNVMIGQVFVEPAVRLDQAILGAAIKRDLRHSLWIELIDERVDVEIFEIDDVRHPLILIAFASFVYRRKRSRMRPDRAEAVGIF